jgi:hypothetical protein
VKDDKVEVVRRTDAVIKELDDVEPKLTLLLRTDVISVPKITLFL